MSARDGDGAAAGGCDCCCATAGAASAAASVAAIAVLFQFMTSPSQKPRQARFRTLPCCLLYPELPLLCRENWPESRPLTLQRNRIQYQRTSAFPKNAA